MGENNESFFGWTVSTSNYDSSFGSYVWLVKRTNYAPEVETSQVSPEASLKLISRKSSIKISQSNPFTHKEFSLSFKSIELIAIKQFKHHITFSFSSIAATTQKVCNKIRWNYTCIELHKQNILANVYVFIQLQSSESQAIKHKLIQVGALSV